MVDARHGVRLGDRACQIAQAAHIGNVEDHDHIGRLDFARRALRVIGCGR